MEIRPATVEQIAAFKKAAAQRYAELGLDPKIANELFELKLATIAEELGMVQPDRIEKLANSLAVSMGKTRITKEAQLGALLAPYLGKAMSTAGKLGKTVGKAVFKGKDLAGKGVRTVGKATQKGVRGTAKGVAKGIDKVAPGTGVSKKLKSFQGGDMREKLTQLLYGGGALGAGAGVGGAAISAATDK